MLMRIPHTMITLAALASGLALHAAPDPVAARVQNVIFSHSSARAITEHPRNVPDNILARMKQNGGIMVVNFYPGYVSNAYNEWDADRSAELARIATPPFSGLCLGQPERAAAALAA